MSKEAAEEIRTDNDMVFAKGVLAFLHSRGFRWKGTRDDGQVRGACVFAALQSVGRHQVLAEVASLLRKLQAPQPIR